MGREVHRGMAAQEELALLLAARVVLVLLPGRQPQTPEQETHLLLLAHLLPMAVAVAAQSTVSEELLAEAVREVQSTQQELTEPTAEEVAAEVAALPEAKAEALVVLGL